MKLKSSGRRSYRQWCAVARALDYVGERWTLLLVRELMVGPKRFKDLLEGLPGIGTNLLTDRLKDLEQAGIVSRRGLPPPAGATVYQPAPTRAAPHAPLLPPRPRGHPTLAP